MEVIIIGIFKKLWKHFLKRKVILFILVLVPLVLSAANHFMRIDGAILTNLTSEFVGIAVTVFLVDFFVDQDRQKEREQLAEASYVVLRRLVARLQKNLRRALDFDSLDCLTHKAKIVKKLELEDILNRRKIVYRVPGRKDVDRLENGIFLLDTLEGAKKELQLTMTTFHFFWLPELFKETVVLDSLLDHELFEKYWYALVEPKDLAPIIHRMGHSCSKILALINKGS